MKVFRHVRGTKPSSFIHADDHGPWLMRHAIKDERATPHPGPSAPGATKLIHGTRDAALLGRPSPVGRVWCRLILLALSSRRGTGLRALSFREGAARHPLSTGEGRRGAPSRGERVIAEQSARRRGEGSGLLATPLPHAGEQGPGLTRATPHP